MKLIAICFYIIVETSSFCAFAQNKSLLFINSEKADTAIFLAGDQVVLRLNSGNTVIKGKINEINDSTLLIGSNVVDLNSIKFIREKTPTGMVIVKSIGVTAAAVGLLGTFLTAAMRPIPTDDAHQQQQYENDLEEYHTALIVGTSVTLIGASTLFIHNPKYDLTKGWHPFIYSPVVPINVDSTKLDIGERKSNDIVSKPPLNFEIAKNAGYLQLSSVINYSLMYDHLWKIDNSVNLSGSIGIGSNQDMELVIPFSLGCVIGRKLHRLEIGQMTWIELDGANPDLLGILAYRFQPYKGQIFIRGGLQITEVSNYNHHEGEIHPFLSVGIGF